MWWNCPNLRSRTATATACEPPTTLVHHSSPSSSSTHTCTHSLSLFFFLSPSKTLVQHHSASQPAQWAAIWSTSEGSTGMCPCCSSTVRQSNAHTHTHTVPHNLTHWGGRHSWMLMNNRWCQCWIWDLRFDQWCRLAYCAPFVSMSFRLWSPRFPCTCRHARLLAKKEATMSTWSFSFKWQCARAGPYQYLC